MDRKAEGVASCVKTVSLQKKNPVMSDGVKQCRRAASACVLSVRQGQVLT